MPETCISADPATIRGFCREHDLNVVAKLVAPGPPRAPTPDEQYVVYTALLDEGDLRDDQRLAAAPAIYQRYVEKDYEVRVTVVDDQVLACAIHSQESPQTRIDWRRYDFDRTPHEAIDLDSAISERCLGLTRRLGLVFAAIDLIVEPSGETIFLEINPNGQWGWIEELTGLPIAEKLAATLAGGR